MKEYKTLLFDIDGTLLDFKKAEDYAMHKTFSDHHLELTSEIFEIYEEINSKLWKDFELGLIDKKTVVLRVLLNYLINLELMKMVLHLKMNINGI